MNLRQTFICGSVQDDDHEVIILGRPINISSARSCAVSLDCGYPEGEAPPRFPEVPRSRTRSSHVFDKIVHKGANTRWHEGAADEHGVDLLDVARIEVIETRHHPRGEN